MNTALHNEIHPVFRHLETRDWLDILHQDRQRRRAPVFSPSQRSERIEIHTLGRFSLLSAGEPLVFPGRARRRPMDLLKMLIALGGRGVCQESLAEKLWPEAEGDTAQRSLETTLHRLRKLLGTDQAIQLRQGLVTLSCEYCWVDIWAFERLQGRLEAMLGQLINSRSRQEQVAALAATALDLYKGRFLGAGHFSSWAEATRQRLHSKYVRLVRRLGEYYQRNGQWLEALEVFERGLEQDDLQEEFCQGAMESCLALDRRSQGISLYHRCRRRLDEELGMLPSRRSEILCRQLLRRETKESA